MEKPPLSLHGLRCFHAILLHEKGVFAAQAFINFSQRERAVHRCNDDNDNAGAGFRVCEPIDFIYTIVTSSSRSICADELAEVRCERSHPRYRMTTHYLLCLVIFQRLLVPRTWLRVLCLWRQTRRLCLTFPSLRSGVLFGQRSQQDLQ